MMWFKRKAKNRRLGNVQVLDVKLRSDQVRATRMRAVALVLGLTFATIFGFFLIWRTGEWTLNRLIYQNKSFAIQEVEVQTDGVVSLEQLRRWAGVKPGENLLALDLARVKRDLEMAPVVRSVAVERVLPRTLRLRISEREPLAQIYVPHLRASGGYDMAVLQLDGDGYVMPVLEPRQRSEPAQPNELLPVVSGLDPSQLMPGRRVDLPQVLSALHLLAAFESSPMSGLVDVRKVDVSSPDILQITTGQGSEVTFAVKDLDRQLRRWRQIYDLGQRMNKAIASLDLSVPNNIPAKWVDAGTLPPAAPRVRNPQRNHTKRNV